MHKTVVLTYKSTRRQFVLSSRTKPHLLKTLIKRAFHFHNEVRCFRNCEGGKVTLDEIFGCYRNNEFEVVLEDESSCQHSKKSRSEACSQKNMSKISGRKKPPSQKELLDSKFYIDDFQLFMSQVSTRGSRRLYGIVFLTNKRKASFLGKKILRELIFEFDQIEFFYALHPIKMHSSSVLLGDICVFILFQGKKMLHERQFPQQITAADEIPNYIRNLIKIGQINFGHEEDDADSFFDRTGPDRRPKNLIFVHEQRSFDDKINNSPDKSEQFLNKLPRTPEMKKPERQLAVPKEQSRSQITHDISFENDFIQPDWFFNGDVMTRIEKSFLSALLKARDANLSSFCQALDLKAEGKRNLNVKLMKVFLQQVVDEKLDSLGAGAKKYIESHQEDRQSCVFSSLLRLYKFGDIENFLSTVGSAIKGGLDKDSGNCGTERKNVIMYSNLAREAEKAKQPFSLKLVGCEDGFDKCSPRQHAGGPFRESPDLHAKHLEISDTFHRGLLPKVDPKILDDLEIGKEFDEADRANILDSILKNDAFLRESFRGSRDRKRWSSMSPFLVKKYMRQVESRYEQIHKLAAGDEYLEAKLHKLQIFMGLAYFLYKQRTINKKQLKIFFYLYCWSDLNLMAAFELYLQGHDIDELVDTLYAIDYNYYLGGLYQIDLNEVQQFTLAIELQLIVLFLFEKTIPLADERMILEKFIRAGDTQALRLLTDNHERNSIVTKLHQLIKAKQQEIKAITSNGEIESNRKKQKLKDRCSFVQQIIPVHFKTFTQGELVKECILAEQPTISAMFDVFDVTNELVQWMQSFTLYISELKDIHMLVLFQELCRTHNLDFEKLACCRKQLIKGIYENHLITGDTRDTLDSIDRAIRKGHSEKSPR